MDWRKLVGIPRFAALAALTLPIGLTGCSSDGGPVPGEAPAVEAPAPVPAPDPLPAGDGEAAAAETPGQEEPVAGEALPGPLPIERNDEMEARAVPLIEGISRGRFARDAVNVENADVFTYLAGTRTPAEDEILIAALHAMLDTYSADGTGTRRAVDEDFVRVSIHHSRCDHGAVAQIAIRTLATAISGSEPDQAALARAVEIANDHPSPAGRSAGIDALGRMRSFDGLPEAAAAFLKAMDADEAYLVSNALFRVNLRANSAPNRDALRSRAIERIAHDDPGVRGRAVQLLATLSSRDPEMTQEAAALIVPRLKDDHPFVQSCACTALAYMDYQPGMHAMVEMVDDMTRNTYDITGWQQLDGSPGRLHHDGSAWSRTADAAISAMRGMSRRIGEPFEVTIRPREAEASLVEAAAVAKAWYESNKDKIPKE